MNAIITRISNKINPIRLVGFCGGCVVGSSSRVWQRSSPALGLQPPTPSVAQLWVALAPQFDYKTCYLSGGFVVQVWWGLPVIPWLGPEFSCQKRLKSTPWNNPVYNPEIRFDFPYK